MLMMLIIEMMMMTMILMMQISIMFLMRMLMIMMIKFMVVRDDFPIPCFAAEDQSPCSSPCAPKLAPCEPKSNSTALASIELQRRT